MTFRQHISRSLSWKWHLQDFVPASFAEEPDDYFVGLFVPRFILAHKFVARFYSGGQFPLTTVSSVRLAFISSIIGAGLKLGKSRKDGEVIARSINIECKKPIIYGPDSKIQVRVKIDFLRECTDYRLFRSKFEVGGDKEHRGSTFLLYCRPGLRNFSYL